MNPTLLKDLILAGHRVACKTHEWNRKVFLFINWKWNFEWTQIQHSIESSLSFWLDPESYTEKEVKEVFTWEYKIVTQLPQLPQVWDTVEVLEICREIPWFDDWAEFIKDMIWKKLEVKAITTYWDIKVYTEDKNDYATFQTRQVAKCEPEEEPTPVSEEKFWDTILFNWKTYKAI